MHWDPQQPFESLPSDVRGQIDVICDEFEAAIKAESSARIEAYLDRIDPRYREVLFWELLPVELTWRAKRRKAVHISEYEVRFREYASHIPRLFEGLFATIAKPGAAKSGNPAAGSESVSVKDLLKPGAQFERYRIISHLGSGNFGDVYRAFDTVLEREVALKLIRARDNEPELVSRFQREAQILAQLAHAHIPQVFEFGHAENRCHISGQLIHGQPLKQRLDETRPMELRTAARIAREVADALAAAHRKGLVHRDAADRQREGLTATIYVNR